MRSLIVIVLAFPFVCFPTFAQRPPGAPDPIIQTIVSAISEERIAANMAKLVSFETRNTLSANNREGKGPQAARQWIFDSFIAASPRLQVRVDKHRVKKFGERFFRDADVMNVVAVLPGKTSPEREFVISAHYDTIHAVMKNVEGGGPNDRIIDGEASAAEPSAPGASDDASGIAAVLELARVMGQYEFDSTIVFIAFDAEEYGLVGSNLYATRANRQKEQIEGVLNNDIIGTESTAEGRAETRRVRVFSEDPSDSPSRSLARYIKRTGEMYVPSMNVDLVFRHDRFARGGDHTSFNQEGFTAVRITSAAENYANQHSTTDSLANASPAYATRVARVNAAALASLALAPKAPDVTRIATTGASKGKPLANIARGESGYAANLRWKNDKPEADLAGYKVLIRSTTSPTWEREIFVGDVKQYVMEAVSIDDFVFGVQSVDKDGHESLVSTYVAAANPKAVFETE
ncbi:MAG: M28 family peptidase [Bryobacteraceae bacterium]